jgi:cytochrome b pre-mRNA-processing protein 3
MLKSLFAPSPAKVAGRALYETLTEAARRPAFYAEAGAPDTPEGRFEVYVLHLVLVVHRLKGEGAQAAAVSQGLFDAFVRGLDDGLREMGVGDLSVGKKMRKLGEAIYGRMKSYDAALAGADPRADVEAVVARTVFAEAPNAGAASVADYLLAARADLAAQPMEALLAGRVRFLPFGAQEAAA